MMFRFDEFDRAFRLLDGLTRQPNSEAPRQPAFSETEEDFGLRLELPGVRAEDVELSLDDGTLTLTAQRTVEPPEDFVPHLRERRSLHVRRSFALPRQVDPERIVARMHEGVLNLRMAKAEVPGPRQITVAAD